MFSANPTPENRGRARIKPKLKVVPSSENFGDRRPNPFGNFLLLILAVGMLFLLYHIYAGDKGSPTVIKEDGEEVLSPHRQAKLDKELEEFDEAVQYVLVATIGGFYPCYTCPDGSPTIFLYENQVWKYGSTRKGEAGRYPNSNYGAPNLRFVEQFWGNELESRKREKFMIYNYPLLPEAKRREVRLFRPPGNKNDS